MKLSVKILLITGACLLFVGIALFAGVMTLLDWNFENLNRSSDTSTEVDEITGEFRNITIRSQTEDIEILLSEDETCRVEFYRFKDKVHSADVDNGTLSIVSSDRRKWYHGISFFTSKQACIKVYLPKKQYGSLVIDEKTGDILLQKDLTFESMDITASTGDVKCCASASGKVIIKLSTGDVRLAGVSTGEMELSLSTGDVHAETVACRGNLNVNVSTGDISLRHVNCGSFNTTGSTSDIKMENVVASDKISIVRSRGDVNFDACDAGELLIRTGTGSVRGTLLTGKTFVASSKTGSVKVPESTSGGRCEITTSTGSIFIEIE